MEVIDYNINKFEINNSSFWKRISVGFARLILLLIIMIPFIIGTSIDNTSIFIIGILVALFFIPFINLIRKSIYYIKTVEFDDNRIQLSIFKYNKLNKKLDLELCTTRISIIELFFPFTRPGRNYKLVISSRDEKLKKYVTVFVQYELGKWNLDEFKKIREMYGTTKGVPTKNDSFNKYGLFK